MGDSTLRKVLNSLILGPAQEFQRGGSLTAQNVVDAFMQGFSPAVSKVVAADATGTADPTIHVFYASKATRVLSLALVADSQVVANGTNYAKFNIKKFATNGGAISSALATEMTTAAANLEARTARSFTLTGGYIDLAAGDMLILEVTHAAGGVALPQFSVVGKTQVI